MFTTPILSGYFLCVAAWRGVDDSDVPETGAVFTFGKSKFAENLPNKFWVKNEDVRQVGCGDEHTAIVAESGRVFMFGPNDWGQLGVGSQKIANRPTCIKSLKHEKSKLVACGRSHTVIATESGNLYTFGANGEGQLGVEGVKDSNVPLCIEGVKAESWAMLAAGCDHSMALTDDGRVYVWGSNGEGQLGLGKKIDIPVPTHLKMDRPVRWISCGYYHSALVTENGQLWTCGESDGGKLGFNDDGRTTNTPQHVAIPDRVTAVSCGGSHTIALTETGNIYAFGVGTSGQLGLGVSVLESELPLLLHLNFKVIQVCCGENFTAIVSESGQLYTCGDGRHGKLALGDEGCNDQFTPTLVDRFVHLYVQQVACGGCHMIVRAKPRTQNGRGRNITKDGVKIGTGSVHSSLQGSADREGLLPRSRKQLEFDGDGRDKDKGKKKASIVEENRDNREKFLEDKGKKRKEAQAPKKCSRLCAVL